MSARGADAPIVSARDLRKTYGGRNVVDGVSFDVQAGEIFGVLGPNGAGKTTAVECVAGLRPLDGGSARVLGIDSQTDSAAVRPVLGMQLQESVLPPRISVGEAIRLYASFYADPADWRELLDMLDLADRAGARYQDLSGGQKQRLSIALALVGKPKVAILDELTTGLDPAARRATWELIEQVRDSGVTIMLVTHFMDEAERLCDRLVVINHGKVVASGSPADIMTAGQSEERVLRLRLPASATTGASAALDPAAFLRALPGVAGVSGEGVHLEVRGDRLVLPTVVGALAEHGVVPDALTTGARSLEDAVVALTGRPISPDGDAEDSGGDGAQKPSQSPADQSRRRPSRGDRP